MTAVIKPIRWSTDDYHQIISTGILKGRKVELINGEIVEMPPESESHAYSSDEAGEYLIHVLGDRAKVRQGKPISIPILDSEPEPDIAIVRRLGEEYRRHHPYPENIFWVMEYSRSSLKKDLEVKTKLYAMAGIPEYWLIDLERKQLLLFRYPEPSGYKVREIRTEGAIVPLAFPDIEIPVGNLID